MATADPGLSTAGASQDAALTRLFRRTLRLWWVVALFAVLAGAAGYFYSSSKPEQFQATATVQLNDLDLGQVFLSQSSARVFQDSETRTATAAKLVNLPRVREGASEILAGELSADDLRSRIASSPQTGTTLIDITATDGDADRAAAIANAVREAYIKTRQQAAVEQLQNVRTRSAQDYERLAKSDRDGAAGEALRTRLYQIDTLIAGANSGVTTAQPAEPAEFASSPRVKRTTVLALVAGGLLGLAIALLWARSDDRIQDADELAEHWDLPVLGLIPQTGELKDGGRHLAGGAALEAFALARTNLRYLHVGGDVRRVVVTSAIAEEGKSTVALNLALAAALADQKVLLIDADLRRPVLASRMGLPGGRGLSEVLAGIAAPREVIAHATVNVGGADVSVDVVPAGLVPPSPIALFERSDAARLLDELGAGYDLVFIDTPPATVVADAKVIMSHADGVVVVSRLNRVTRDAVDRLRDLLTGLDTPVLGAIVNSGATAKSYGYHSYESVPNTPPATASSPREESASLSNS